MPEVTFSTDGLGHWWKREYSKQCPVDGVFLFSGRCQGVEGHKGFHWCYSENGSLNYRDNKNDPTENGCSGTIPPGHEKYVSPIDKMDDYWLTHSTDSEVNDPDEIQRLEDDVDIRENESIIRPVLESELTDDLKERLKKYKLESENGM